MACSMQQQRNAVIADTLVICRASQIREAAIALSCLRHDSFIPLITVESPPSTEQQYVELYRRYEKSYRGFMGEVGGDFQLANLKNLTADQRAEALREIQESRRLRRDLSAYRSWVQHNAQIALFVEKVAFKRVVYLFQPTQTDFTILDPGIGAEFDSLPQNSRSDSPHEHPLTRIPEQLFLLPEEYGDLSSLTSFAWKRLRPDEPEPISVVECDIGSPPDIVLALALCIRSRSLLRPAKSQNSTPRNGGHIDFSDDPAEAVLVENDGSAQTLLAALYASHRSARLISTPPPDLSQVRQEVDRRQEAVVRASSRKLGATTAPDASNHSPKGISRRYLQKVATVFTTFRRTPFASIQTAVTAQIVPSAVEAVGNRPLTAITAGLPYTFLRTQTADWRHKPIGHLTGDPTLIILRELLAEHEPRPEFGFSLIFDTGYFRDSETTHVFGAVQQHYNYPLLLGGESANLDALISLPKILPVEMIFFNTHGSDDSIMLSEMPIESYVIPQWCNFKDAPFIFNNSCQSWTGVGREFVRSGARGYIGSLWSIPSRSAAQFARVVIERLAAGDAAVAEAIVKTGVAVTTEMSYIFVGTVNARLGSGRARRVSSLPTDTQAQVAALCNLLVVAAGKTGNRSVARTLEGEVTRLRQALVQREPTASHIDMLLNALELSVHHEIPVPEDALRSKSLIDDVTAALSHSNLAKDAAGERWARLHALTGDFYARFGSIEAAQTAYKRAVDLGDLCSGRDQIYLLMAQNAMHQGRHSEAKEFADLAREIATPGSEQVIAAVGILGQLARRNDDPSAAMDYAVQGYKMSQAVRNRSRQGTFKLDESMVHQMNSDIVQAIDSALAALKLFREAGDDRGELAGIGRLCVYYELNGDLARAYEYATSGLEHARRLGLLSEEAAFLSDQARLLAGRGDVKEAFNCWRDALQIFLHRSQWEMAVAVYRDFSWLAVDLTKPEALWFTAASGARICAAVDEPVWTELLLNVVTTLKKACVLSDREVITDQLNAIANILGTDAEADQKPQVFFLHSLLELLYDWTRSPPVENTLDLATLLDQQTSDAARLQEFVANPYTPPE
jgi:tetratricopeptide (TPR) repeat protein